MNAVIQYPNRAAQRKSRKAATLRLKEEARVFRATHDGMEKGPYMRHRKKYGRVIVVTTAAWHKKEVTKLAEEGGSAFVWMSRWPHYSAGIVNGAIEVEYSCFTHQDE